MSTYLSPQLDTGQGHLWLGVIERTQQVTNAAKAPVTLFQELSLLPAVSVTFVVY